MRLYTYFRSSAAWRVRIALNLKGLPWTAEYIHLLKDGGQQNTPSYRATNPTGLVPTLETDDGVLLGQSLAIIEWLEETHPTPALLPRDPVARAHVRAFALTIACDIHPLNNLRVLRYLKDAHGQDQAARDAWYAHWIAEGLAAVEAMLRGPGPFCFGEAPTLADLCLVPQMGNARRLHCPLEAYPTLLRAEFGGPGAARLPRRRPRPPARCILKEPAMTEHPETQSGFGNEFATEAVQGAVPVGQNSPQRHPLGLYAEQITGTPFTVPRCEARRTWLYRIRPTANHPPYRRIDNGLLCTPLAEPMPNRLRWDPLPIPDAPTDFLAGLVTIAANETRQGTGVTLHIYRANRSMERVFWNADGELLIVPQRGRLAITTEMGRLEVAPREIAVIPRGVRFRVALPDGEARGYICENHGPALRLPDLGPIGSNGLANPRDFEAPVAWFEDREEPTEIVQKFEGTLWAAGTRPLALRRRRLARQFHALSIRPRALHGHQHGQLRSPGPVDLHRADRAHRGAGRGQHRLRHLPAALDGGRAHVPPALVSSQRDERVCRPRAWGVRRQGHRLRPRGRLAA